MSHQVKINYEAIAIQCNSICEVAEKQLKELDEMIATLEETSTQPTLPVSSPKVVLAPIDKATERVHKLILAIGDRTMPRRQIIAYLGLKQNGRCNFINNYLRPAMTKGYIVMARPSSPNSPEQAYRLSADGLELWSKLNS